MYKLFSILILASLLFSCSSTSLDQVLEDDNIEEPTDESDSVTISLQVDPNFFDSVEDDVIKTEVNHGYLYFQNKEGEPISDFINIQNNVSELKLPSEYLDETVYYAFARNIKRTYDGENTNLANINFYEIQLKENYQLDIHRSGNLQYIPLSSSERLNTILSTIRKVIIVPNTYEILDYNPSRYDFLEKKEYDENRSCFTIELKANNYDVENAILNSISFIDNNDEVNFVVVADSYDQDTIKINDDQINKTIQILNWDETGKNKLEHFYLFTELEKNGITFYVQLVNLYGFNSTIKKQNIFPQLFIKDATDVNYGIKHLYSNEEKAIMYSQYSSEIPFDLEEKDFSPYFNISGSNHLYTLTSNEIECTSYKVTADFQISMIGDYISYLSYNYESVHPIEGFQFLFHEQLLENPEFDITNREVENKWGYFDNLNNVHYYHKDAYNYGISF
ncbi:hypothetical protein KMW28_02785 [Flammeovirga yaeyamensis]|uniref:SbsA Ig-like domain-containing protein n=1 Tax=Flammeovirga yaeyamensis TaxID=367791 RepID=A0AAX1N508_9BACT|nr:hypothetical protein [Flammeovirga yaeyamensis]MBB3700439.1 hypothetical protein [Flammeovirga yaeyamensis]NMF36937.1 hypothetical protein [Flammeovirga yaeyamensis]QWG02517.1 hypothetical protein KMW28_02785 [Flammeovirga yaeyamensis]